MMPTWTDLRDGLGLPKRRAPWLAVWVVLVLLVAGWLLQERVTAPSANDLDYSDLCRFIDEGKVELVVIKGQAVEGDFFEPQKIAGHPISFFHATAPTNDLSFWPMLHDKKVRVRVIATGPGLFARLVLGLLPLVFFIGFALWASRGAAGATPALPNSASPPQG